MSKKVIKLTEKDLHRIIESVINEQRLSGDLFQIRNASGRALGEVVFNKTSVDNTMGLIRLYVKSGIKAEYVTYMRMTRDARVYRTEFMRTMQNGLKNEANGYFPVITIVFENESGSIRHPIARWSRMIEGRSSR